MTPWFVYIIECKGSKLYTGIAPDVKARFEKHVAGKGAKFTKMNRPERILAASKFPDKSSAAKVEYFLKKQLKEVKLLWIQANCWQDE